MVAAHVKLLIQAKVDERRRLKGLRSQSGEKLNVTWGRNIAAGTCTSYLLSANKPCLFTYPYVASAKWSPHLLHLCLFCSVSIKDRAVLCQARRHCPFLCLRFGASQVSVAEVASGQAFKARSLPLRQCLNVMHTSKVCLLPGSGPTFSCALSMQALMRHIC